MTPDLILTNARVLTMDPARPRGEAVALAGAKILAVGKRAEIEALAGSATEILDCHGGSLLPGFVESHLHLVLGGAELAHLQLGHVEGAAALARAFHDFAASHPGRPLLMAQGGKGSVSGKCVAGNTPNQPIPQREDHIENARGSWGQLQWLFGGIVVDQAQISDCYAYAKRESRQEESQASGYSQSGKLNSQPSSNRARQLFQ